MKKAFSGGSSQLPDNVDFRPIRNADLEFLQALYASTRFDELNQVPWTQAQKDEFLESQFQAQHKHYQDHYPQADFLIIKEEGTAIGRVYVDRREDEIRLIDIALLPESRNQGLGSLLMEELLEESQAANKPVYLHVESFNPAFRLYQRLGFEVVEDRGVYQFMCRKP